MVSFLWVVIHCSTAYSQPDAVKGYLILTQTDLEELKHIPLSGEWEFYWGKLLSPDEINTVKREFVQFPGLWNDIPEINGGQGYATYRLQVIVPSDHPPLALRLPDFYTAYKLYVNGEKVANNGKVGTNADTYIPYWDDKVISVKSDPAGYIDIILHIANFEHRRGGAGDPIYLGIEENIRSFQSREYHIAFLLAGCLLMGGLFFLGLFLFGRHDKSMLFFSLFCLFYSYRMVGFEIYPIHDLLNWPWIVTTKLEYITMFMSVLFFTEYTRHLYPREIDHGFINILSGISALFTLITLFSSAIVFTHLAEPFSIILPVYIFYATWVYFKAALNDRTGARLALASTFIIFIVVLYNLLSFFGYIEENMWIILNGYVSFIFMQSLILSYRFASTLKHARDRAQQASIAKSQFLSTMSHEIRTPLNAVIGMSGLINQTRLTEEQAEYAKTIRLSGENLLNIINNILDYSKIESGNLELEWVEFKIKNLMEDVLDLMSPLIQKKKLELLYFIGFDMPGTIKTDLTRLQQVLVNLIGNAVKFTEKGEIFVRVSNNRVSSKKGNILFEVRDTGIGIPEEKMEKLFKSFSQVDASTTRKYGGTGLGLIISKKLVEAMGGTIWVESEPGAGSSFYFTIQAEIISDQPDHKIPGILKGKKIFVVDDNETSLTILEILLEKAGCTVETVSNPEKLIANIDLLKSFEAGIIDMQMPNINGIEVARKIRTRWNSTDLPIILLSSIFNLVNHENERLFNGRLTKPVKHSYLYKHLADLLGKPSEMNTMEKSVNGVKEEPPEYTSSLKILVAEDNLINQRVATKIMEQLGYHTDIAQNGQEALKLTYEIPYDLVFMDMNMPVMDGLEATKKMRAKHNFVKGDPVIIAMTANALKEDRDKCLQAGMDDFISKPVTVESTRKVIEKWFG